MDYSSLSDGSFSDDGSDIVAIKDDICIQLFDVGNGDFIRQMGKGDLHKPRGT